MKTIFTLMLTAISIFSLAATPVADDKVSARVQASLEKEFAGAQYIVWQELKRENVYSARFIYNNEQISAFFDADGKLLATGRIVTQAALPFMASKSIRNLYECYEFRDATEYTRDGETSYLVTLESEKHELVVQAYSSGSTYIVRKTKKKL